MDGQDKANDDAATANRRIRHQLIVEHPGVVLLLFRPLFLRPPDPQIRISGHYVWLILLYFLLGSKISESLQM